MSHSVVKVTESLEDDRLLMLVGEDGTVTPDRDTVDQFLKSREGPTNVQVMHMTKAEGRTIELSVENLTYVHSNEDDQDVEEEVRFEDMDEVARNLFTFRLDHDYTPLTSPKHSPVREAEPVDELAETLSLLDGGEVENVAVSPPKTVVKSAAKAPAIKKSAVTQQEQKSAKAEVKTQPKTRQGKSKAKEIEEEDYEDEEDEDFDEENEDNDDNDSDFELEEPKQRPSRRSQRTRSKSTIETKKQANKAKAAAAAAKPKTPTKQVVEDKPLEKPPPPPPPPPPQPVEVPTEKKQAKKEKKTPKPIPDDFALFSTPDIIRRVGSKEQITPPSPEAQTKPPAKISPENRSKSNTESRNSINKPPATRLSVDSKSAPEKANKAPITYSVRRVSSDKAKVTSKPTNEPKDVPDETQPQNDTTNTLNPTVIDLMPPNNTEDVPSDVLNDNTLPDDVNIDQNNINLETAGLELDQSILDNINSDMISDDILYQVAKQLVDNSTDLQNVLDKSLADGNLELEAALMSGSQQEDNNMQNIENHQPQQETSYETPPPAQKGTQIVRPDGRIVVIPPIERPTTRSRNKKETEKTKLATKPPRKPLDDEHVSGNELDSSESEEDKSEDDPDKLWCICNQPHNNRFMICCDTCEEWYHGKCVNVTKAMGQLMEQEGREWICVYCKDPSLTRPKAAARRIRKASKTSNDSSGSAKKSEQPQRQSSILACIVCSKPSRKNSIYCSEACILKHAQGVERVVVFDRASGKILSGNKAPSAANIEKWLKEHPTYEVVRSTSKNIPNTKLTQSKLKLVKNTTNDGVSLAVQKKGVNVGVLQHAPKSQQQHADKKQQQVKQATTAQPLKVISKKIPLQQSPQQQQKVRVLNSEIALKSQQTPTKPKATVQTTLKVTSIEKKEKERPTVQRTPKPKQQEQSSQQPKQQENIRENVYKTLSEQLMNRLKEAKDLTLSEEEVNNISTEIESQLFKCFGDTGQKYKNKYRSLIFNIKDAKNQTLWRRICEKSISPYQLVRLSPDDMASQELALWREREAKHQLDMIKKSELELLNCNRQYVFKTHKGEQVLEDDRPNDSIDSTEVIANLGADSTSLDSSESKLDSKDKDKKSVKHGRRDKEKDHKSSRDSRDHKKRHRSSSKDRDKRKRSRSRDRSSRHSERKRSRSRDRHRHTSHKSSRHKKDNTIVATDKLDKRSKEILEQLVDKQIVPPLEDRLWKHVPQEDVVPAANVESDSDHEPSSTVTIPTPPRNSEVEESATVSTKGSDKGSDSDAGFGKDVIRGGSPSRPPPEFVWKGTVSMVDVAQISITAHEVSGDCNGLGDELPANLEIVGRISPETVWDYIGKMKCSNSKTISLLRLTATNVEERMPYIALYSYLSSRNRLGVVKSTNKAVKDFYILPLAVQKPIPQALLPINGPGFEESRPPLLLGIIVRDKRKRALLMEPSHPVKKVRVEIDIPPEPPVVTPAVPARSYTPPPTRDPRVKQPYTVETPPVVPPEETPADDMDEPYSPEDSDPDTIVPSVDPTTATVNTEEIPLIPAAIKAPSFLDTSLTNPTQTFEPFSNKFDTIPGLEDAALPSSSQELQKKMEELDQRIAMQKAEIDTMSQDIVSTATASSDIGTTALASISLPSNLQQILDNIKTIGSTVSTDSQDSQGSGSDNASASGVSNTAELTIPLMLPKIGSRPVPKPSEPPPIPISSTIPLNIPTKPKRRINTTPPPINLDPDKNLSVLSSLTEEDLIRKAEEMLGEAGRKEKDDVSDNTTPPPAPALSFSQPPPPLNAKKPKLDLPPVPGLEDDT